MANFPFPTRPDGDALEEAEKRLIRLGALEIGIKNKLVCYSFVLKTLIKWPYTSIIELNFFINFEVIPSRLLFPPFHIDASSFSFLIFVASHLCSFHCLAMITARFTFFFHSGTHAALFTMLPNKVFHLFVSGLCPYSAAFQLLLSSLL